MISTVTATLSLVPVNAAAWTESVRPGCWSGLLSSSRRAVDVPVLVVSSVFSGLPFGAA